MRLLLPSFILLLSLSGCGQRSTQNDSTATADSSTSASTPEAAQPDTLCFQQVVGRDSTKLRLIIRDSTVTGELNVLPFEKDRARGSIQGTVTNNQIQADWARSGEGVTETYEIAFTMKGDAITWREGERIEKQGKWILKDQKQSYEYVLMKTDCQ